MGTGLGVKGIAVDCAPTLAERKATLGSVPARQGTDAQKNPVGQAVPDIEHGSHSASGVDPPLNAPQSSVSNDIALNVRHSLTYGLGSVH